MTSEFFKNALRSPKKKNKKYMYVLFEHKV